MAEVGFIRTSMPEETRVAILPKEISQLSHPERTFIEQGYARHLGIDDDQYQKSGAKIVSRTEAYDKGAVCVPKPWIDDLEDFKPGQVAMGWFYLAEKKDLARATIDKEMTVIGWQDMYDADKNYTFERNRWFAGYIGVTQALPFAYASPKRLNIGVLGTKNGRVARGAIKRLEEEGLVEGENFETFGRNGQERFRSLLSTFDVVISCGYYDPTKGYLLTLRDLQEMKNEALLIDACSDGIEGCEPHPAISPFFWLGRHNRVLVYNNNHTPTMWPLEVSETMSEDLAPHLDDIINERTNPVLERATILKEGEIIDQRIRQLLEE